MAHIGDLFSKTRSTKPANAMGPLTTAEILNVVAVFLLPANGFRGAKKARSRTSRIE